MGSAGRHAESIDEPARRWPARRWSLLLIATLVLGCVAAVVWSRAESEWSSRREARHLATAVATSLAGQARDLGRRLGDLPADCSASSPVALGGYAVVVDGAVRCSVGLDPASVAAVRWSPGLRFPPEFVGRAAVAVPSRDSLVVGLVPVVELAGGRPPGSPWVILGPRRGGDREAVSPATASASAVRGGVTAAVGDGVVAVGPEPVAWAATWRPLLLVAAPLLLALALHRRVVTPLGRLVGGADPGPACRELEELAATCAADEAARRDLVLDLERSRAEERRRLAVQLHDVPVQELTGANMLLAAMATTGDWSGTDEVRASLRTAAAELRRLSSELLPTPVERVGLTQALLEQVEVLAEGHPEVVVEPRVADAAAVDAALSGPVADMLLRNIVEAVRNAVQHSGGRHVDVDVGLEAVGGRRGVRAVVRDDGRGVDEAARTSAERHGHIGLASMRSLVESAGGSIRVESTPGRGTTVTLELPLDGAEVS